MLVQLRLQCSFPTDKVRMTGAPEEGKLSRGNEYFNDLFFFSVYRNDFTKADFLPH